MISLFTFYIFSCVLNRIQVERLRGSIQPPAVQPRTTEDQLVEHRLWLKKFQADLGLGVSSKVMKDSTNLLTAQYP